MLYLHFLHEHELSHREAHPCCEAYERRFSEEPCPPAKYGHLGHFRGSGLLKTHEACEGFIPQGPKPQTGHFIGVIKGQRTHTLHFLDIRNRAVITGLHRYRIGDLLQQSRPGYHQSELELINYPDDETFAYYIV